MTVTELPTSQARSTLRPVERAAYVVAVAWVTSYLRMPQRTRVVLLGVLTVDCVVEVLGITVQAWRHVPSHLSRETPFDTVVAVSLALGGGVMVVTLGAFAVIALRGRADVAPSMRLALCAGFGPMLVGLASGAAMIVRGTTLQAQGHLQEEAYDHASPRTCAA